MVTATARKAHTTDHYWQAEALVAKLEDLAFHYGAGLVESADVLALAGRYQQEADQIAAAAYAAGRGYAATQRVTGYAWQCANELAFMARPRP